MIVTLNEIQRACQKALAGCGVPAGIDDEAGSAAAWLEARGLQGIGPVVAALDRWARDETAARLVPSSCDGDSLAFAADGRSAVYLDSLLLDAAVAAAAKSGGTSRLGISGLADPWFLLPPARLLQAHGWSFALDWIWEDGARAAALVRDEEGTSLLGDWPDSAAGQPCSCEVRCHGGAHGALFLGDIESLEPVIREEGLEARARAALARGIEVDEDRWRRLSDYARRALVPATAESRARGAGVVGSERD